MVHRGVVQPFTKLVLVFQMDFHWSFSGGIFLPELNIVHSQVLL